jgi:signal transduction histidine kinase
MLGAAIGTAAVLVAASLGQLLVEITPVPWAAVAPTLLLVPLLGLVPGARELEVTAARVMLRVPDDRLVAAARLGRWRSVGWVVAHLVLGLLAGFLLLGVVPGAVVVAVSAVAGADDVLARVSVPPPDGVAATAVVVLVAVAGVLACVVAVWAVGALATRLAPTFLGATARDRLLVAEARLAAEVEHVRLARELHDGIGHALTVIAVQATAGRRGAVANADRATEALEVIETAARQALTELDGLLGVLRDEVAEPIPEPDLRGLTDLVDVHRRNQLAVRVESDTVDDLPALVSRSAYRILAEALTNAQRYAGPGDVDVRIRRTATELQLEVTSPLTTTTGGRRRPGGHGLQGVRERVRLLGGSVQAGPERDSWILRAGIPIGESR